MNAFLHTLGTLVVLPYMLLAVAFLLIGDIARSRGMLALIDAVANHAHWIFRWGIYGLFAFLVAFVVAGFLPSLQRICAAGLFLIAFGCLVVICTLHSTRIGLGEVTFLLPCIAVLGMSAWQFVRERTPPIGSSKVAPPSLQGQSKQLPLDGPSAKRSRSAAAHHDCEQK